jgi:hypothetical protein
MTILTGLIGKVRKHLMGTLLNHFCCLLLTDLKELGISHEYLTIL